jgi:hypothetical protein
LGWREQGTEGRCYFRLELLPARREALFLAEYPLKFLYFQMSTLYDFPQLFPGGEFQKILRMIDPEDVGQIHRGYSVGPWIQLLDRLLV